MIKIFSVVLRTINIFIAVPSVLALSQIIMVDYMLIVGDVRPGNRMMYDAIAPSYGGATVLTLVLLILLVVAFSLSKKADKLSRRLE